MEAATLPSPTGLEPVSRRTSLQRRALRLGSLALTLAAAVFWIAVLRPASLGGGTEYVIVSGASMEPTYHAGDAVVARRQSSYGVGDVVVYRVPAGKPAAGSHVIHRIVGGSGAAGFILRGDNKEGVDPWRPTADDVIGKARFSVPNLGFGLIFLRTPLGVALIASLTTFLVALVPAQTRRRNRPS